MIDLAAIRKRAEAATPGPWKVEKNEKNATSGKNWLLAYFGLKIDHAENKDYHYFLTTDNVRASNLVGGCDKDSEFVAHARTDIPALLDELERIRAAALELREALKNESSNFRKLGEAHTIDLSEVYDYAAEALAKTKWLEGVE
jgi:hypothetical protein